jgi:hypothetical protein
MERGSRRRVVLSAVVVADLVLAVFAWRDLAGRTDDAVRGTKRMWRVAIIANPGNALAYWVVGRRRD